MKYCPKEFKKTSQGCQVCGSKLVAVTCLKCQGKGTTGLLFCKDICERCHGTGLVLECPNSWKDRKHFPVFIPKTSFKVPSTQPVTVSKKSKTLINYPPSGYQLKVNYPLPGYQIGVNCPPPGYQVGGGMDGNPYTSFGQEMANKMMRDALNRQFGGMDGNRNTPI
jgi:hypothetical protein